MTIYLLTIPLRLIATITIFIAYLCMIPIYTGRAIIYQEEFEFSEVTKLLKQIWK